MSRATPGCTSAINDRSGPGTPFSGVQQVTVAEDGTCPPASAAPGTPWSHPAHHGPVCRVGDERSAEEEGASMTTDPRVIAAVLAGGVGARMGAPTPKQLLPLEGRPIITHAIDAFESCP